MARLRVDVRQRRGSYRVPYTLTSLLARGSLTARFARWEESTYLQYPCSSDSQNALQPVPHLRQVWGSQHRPFSTYQARPGRSAIAELFVEASSLEVVDVESKAFGSPYLRLAFDVDVSLLLRCENNPDISVSQSRRSLENGGVGMSGRSVYLISDPADSKSCRMWILTAGRLR